MKKLLLLLFSIPFLGFSQGSMDFENTTLPSAYADGAFDDNGITYTYGHSRDQDTFNITNNGLMLRRASDSYLEWTIPDGIGTLSFEYRKAFTGGTPRQLEILIDDVVTFTTVEFGEGSGAQTDVYTFSEEINVEGSVTIKIKNVGTATGNKQAVIDNIVWTAHEGGSTEPEMGEATIQVGSGSGNSSYFPNYYLFNYSYTQTIYTADELHAAGAHANGGEISMIKYLPKASESTEKWRNFAIYMVNTSKEGFDDDTDWVDFASLTPVFDGDLIDNTVANQWMEITLDNPFDWNGSDNILVAVVDKTPGWGGKPNWAGYTLAPSAGSKGIYKYSDVDPIDLIDPASGLGTANVSNTIAQIQFFGTLQEVCTGTPTVGTVAQPLEICKNQPFTLSLDGTTEGLLGITYQWQESADGTTWTDMIGANTASYTVTDGVTEEGFYRLIITCTNSSQTVISNAIETTIKPGVDCYCTPEGTNENRFINNFSTTQGIQNVSNLNSGFSTEGYGDFTAMIIEQVQGASVDFSATIDGGTAGFKIWIDWNQDGNFAPSESVFNTSSFVSSTTGTITVPLDALPGTTRMRIVSNWSVNTGGENPCATNYALGEFEDYTFEVTELTACTGTPDAGTVADIETCEMVPFTLSTDGVSTGAAGLTYQWEESTDGITWTDLVGANTASYTVTDGVTEEGFYRLVVTCVNSTETATSDAIATTLKVASECYCIPVGTNSSRFINNFSTTQGIQNVSNLNSGFSTEGYGDFTAMIIEQVQGASVDFTGNISGGSAGFKIWVDWNQDGTFESTEVAYQSSGYSTSPGGSFTVPLDALPGTTRMRIVSNYSVNTGGENPCATNYALGEFEDYTFEVIELTACAGTPEAGTVTDIETCGMEPFTLSTDGASSGQSGLTYQWEESTDGTTWTDLVGANTASYNVSTGISTETSYRLVVTCENTSESVTSDALVVSLKAASECYCETNYGSGIEPITLVEVKDGTTTLFSNSSPTTSSVAHEDFTSISADVAREAEYEITVKGNTDGSFTSKITIYIDWNQDGNFNETTEKYTFPDIDNSTGEDAIVSVETITVPTDALLGETRMRVTKRFSSVATPCNTAGFGQTEDYTLNVEPAQVSTCEDLEANIGDDCTDADGNEGTVNEDCECEVETTDPEFDCEDLEANIGDDCTDADGNEGTVNEDCECEVETTDPEFDCEDLEANIGDDCTDADGNEGTVNEDCECEVETTDPEFDCEDLEANIGDDCTDADGNEGTVNEDCECEVETTEPEFDCEDLEANIGDDCTDADGNEGTVNEDCECEVETTDPEFDCEDLEANIGDDCTDADGEEGIVNDDCECEPTSGLSTEQLGELNLFPNPSKEYVNVTYDGAYTIETIVVISPIGQKVSEVKVNGDNYQLDVNKYATGLYHMNIILSNGEMITRNFDVMK